LKPHYRGPHSCHRRLKGGCLGVQGDITRKDVCNTGAGDAKNQEKKRKNIHLTGSRNGGAKLNKAIKIDGNHRKRKKNHSAKGDLDVKGRRQIGRKDLAAVRDLLKTRLGGLPFFGVVEGGGLGWESKPKRNNGS